MNPLTKATWVLIAACLLIIIGCDVHIASEHQPQDLEIDVRRSSAASQMQVYFDTGSGFSENASATVPLVAGDAPQQLDFPLPAGPVKALRIDPSMTEGTVVVTAMKILARSSRRTDRPLELARVAPMHEIARLTLNPGDGSLEIVTTPGSTDSSCTFALDHPLTGTSMDGRAIFLACLSSDLSILFIYTILFIVFWFATGQSPARWWCARPAGNLLLGRWHRFVIMLLAATLICYVWLLLLNLGRSPTDPGEENSWAAVMTYAIANHWQFGKEIILTYGPLMPLTICSYIGRIDTAVFVGRLVLETWSLVLMIWLGLQLKPARRWVFWGASVTLAAGYLQQPYYYFSIVAAGLLLARGRGAYRWLVMPTIVYLASIALVKVSYLTFAVLILGVVALDRARRGQWLGAIVPALFFTIFFLTEWCLCGQHMTNLPLYFRGSAEMVSGFSQAMSLPPKLATLQVLLVMVGVTMLHLGSLFFVVRRLSRWIDDLPMLGLLAGGLLLAWRAGVVRADGHLLDWFVYAMISAAAAPAFFPMEKRAVGYWMDRACLAGILLAGSVGLVEVSPEQSHELASLFRDRWRSNLTFVLHPRSLAQMEKQSVLQNRLTYALPRIRGVVGQSTVDVFCDEQAIAILNGLNYRPRPSFVSYSTYTPWLMDFDLAFYCSPQGPEYVLFKLESIDNRLPTIQNAPLLIVLEKFYTEVLTENDFVLFHRREQPKISEGPTAFPLLTRGDFSLSDTLILPVGEPVWCELELHETLAGKLLKFFYQQPALNLAVNYADGRTDTHRLIPVLTPAGFLINPLPSSTVGFMQWLARQPLPAVRSIRLMPPASTAAIFAPRASYRFYRVPVPGS